jgi:transcriptional regulator with XRE-family HTH domain
MILSERLRALREANRMSQEKIAERTGFPDFFVSRVENGEEIPALATLEKWAAALGVPVHQLFFETDALPSLPNLPGRLTTEEISKSGSENIATTKDQILPRKKKNEAP